MSMKTSVPRMAIATMPPTIEPIITATVVFGPGLVRKSGFGENGDDGLDGVGVGCVNATEGEREDGLGVEEGGSAIGFDDGKVGVENGGSEDFGGGGFDSDF